MNHVKRILKSLTPNQREALEEDIEKATQEVMKAHTLTQEEMAEVNINTRLPDEVYLHITLFFHYTGTKINAVIHDLKKMKSVDEYLDALIKARTPAEGFTKIKYSQ